MGEIIIAGGALPGAKKRNYKNFDEHLRTLLAILWNEEKLTKRQIALKLGFTWVGINNELERGFTGVYDEKL